MSEQSLTSLTWLQRQSRLKGWPAYKYRAGKFETNFLQSMTRSDHRINVTLGTDIKFTLNFLYAKSLC